jgi:hypothetical protein
LTQNGPATNGQLGIPNSTESEGGSALARFFTVAAPQPRNFFVKEQYKKGMTLSVFQPLQVVPSCAGDWRGTMPNPRSLKHLQIFNQDTKTVSRTTDDETPMLPEESQYDVQDWGARVD